MQSLSSAIEEWVRLSGGDWADTIRVAQNNAAWAACVRRAWKNRDAHNLILAHTNAFYVRRDDRPRKGPDKDKPYIVCEVCIDDPLVRSEVDARRGLLQLFLLESGLTFNEFRILPARLGMRKRHPFLRLIDDVRNR